MLYSYFGVSLLIAISCCAALVEENESGDFQLKESCTTFSIESYKKLTLPKDRKSHLLIVQTLLRKHLSLTCNILELKNTNLDIEKEIQMKMTELANILIGDTSDTMNILLIRERKIQCEIEMQTEYLTKLIEIFYANGMDEGCVNRGISLISEEDKTRFDREHSQMQMHEKLYGDSLNLKDEKHIYEAYLIYNSLVLYLVKLVKLLKSTEMSIYYKKLYHECNELRICQSNIEKKLNINLAKEKQLATMIFGWEMPQIDILLRDVEDEIKKNEISETELLEIQSILRQARLANNAIFQYGSTKIERDFEPTKFPIITRECGLVQKHKKFPIQSIIYENNYTNSLMKWYQFEENFDANCKANFKDLDEDFSENCELRSEGSDVKMSKLLNQINEKMSKQKSKQSKREIWKFSFVFFAISSLVFCIAAYHKNANFEIE